MIRDITIPPIAAVMAAQRPTSDNRMILPKGGHIVTSKNSGLDNRLRARRLRHAASVIALTGSCMLAAQSAHAGAAADTRLEIEEIVVTATKRETKLQDTPMSISAFSGKKLDEMGAQNFSDYYRSVPGLMVVDSGPQRKKYFIRGIQNDVITGGGTVSVYYDDIPNAGSIDPQLFDIERVEVLRGPQGTLYGASAMAGVVRIVSNKADVSEFSATVKGQAGKVAHGDEDYGLNAMVNIPVIEDKLGVRAVAYYRQEGGFIDHVYGGAVIPGQPEIPLGPGLSVPATDPAVLNPINIKNANDRETYGARLSARLQATEDLTVTANIFHEKTEVDGAQNDQPLEAGPLRNGQSVVLPLTGNTNIYNLTVEYAPENVTLYSTTNYLKGKGGGAQETLSIWDNIAGGLFSRFNGPGTVLQQEVRQSTFTQEVRALSTWDKPFNFTIGGYYTETRRDRDQVVYRQQDQGNESLNATIIDDGNITEKSVFGELSYNLTPDLTALVGMRLADVKTLSRAIRYNTDSPIFVLPRAGLYELNLRSREKSRTMKYSLSYNVTDDVMVYGLASQGFRPGGPNQVVPGTAIPPEFGSDTLWNYEIGAKTSWLDERLVANVTFYYVDWKDIQVTDFIDGFGFAGNAGAAHIAGIELETTAQPIDGLVFSLNGSLLEAKLDEDQPINPNPLLQTGNEGRKGENLPGVPRLTLSASAMYDFPINDTLNGVVRIDWSYTGGSDTRFSDRSPENARLKAYHLTNLRAGVRREPGWSADLYVNNLFDKRADLNILDFQNGSVVHTPNRPRVIGIEVTKQF